MNLPRVFQNKNINLEEKERKVIPTKKNINITNKINNLFKQTNYVYKINALIETKEGTKEVILIGKTRDYVITLDNNLILIKDIIDINEKNRH